MYFIIYPHPDLPPRGKENKSSLPRNGTAILYKHLFDHFVYVRGDSSFRLPLRFALGFGFIRNDSSFVIREGSIGDSRRRIAYASPTTQNSTVIPSDSEESPY
jgi:hypothetical protein